jgi:hypothetical protein
VFDHYGTIDFIVGRIVWISLFAWLFWWAIVGARGLHEILQACDLRPHLWAAEGDGGTGVIGTSILALCGPLFVATVLGAVWLLPTFTEIEGGAKAIAILPSAAVFGTISWVFVPCIWTVHRRLSDFKTAALREVSAELRSIHGKLANSAQHENSTHAERLPTLSAIRSEMEKLPTWPFATKGGIILTVTQLGAIGATILKARDIYENSEKYLVWLRVHGIIH